MNLPGNAVCVFPRLVAAERLSTNFSGINSLKQTVTEHKQEKFK